MKILLTNAILNGFTGTEIVVRDLARELVRSGHHATIYSPRLGCMVDEMRSAGVSVTDDLFSLTDSPDIIHGHHHQPLMEALLRFPMTPAIYVSHDAILPLDEPCAFPRIRRYFAVDERCRDRVKRVLGNTAGEVEIIPNAVDTDRFKPRAPLPAQPRRALLFSSYAHGGTQLPAIRKACRKAGIQLDVMGKAMGTESAHPETVLPQYDLVFAKARCALEAMAVGNAVILCDFVGMGKYVMAEDFDVMRPKNFGLALLTEPINPDALLEQISRYNASDADALRARVRNEASLHRSVAKWLSIYTEVLAGFDIAQLDRAEESRATALYLSRWHYFRRREWEIAQLRRLQAIPLAGKHIFRGIERLLQRWRPFSE